jgi:hypothetical protein
VLFHPFGYRFIKLETQRERATVNYSTGLVDIMSRFSNDFAPSARVKKMASVGGNGQLGRENYRKNKKKGKVLPTHFMKAYRGVEV